MVSHRSSRRHARPDAGRRGPHRQGPSRRTPARIVALSAAAGAAAALAPAVPAGAQPGDEAKHQPSRSAVGARVDRLYEQAEVATEKYNGAAERADRLGKQVEYAQGSAARGQAKVNRLRTVLGSVAGAQYRSGGIDPSVQLLLSENPDSYLEKASTLDRIGSRQRDRLDRLRSAQRSLAQQRAEASTKLDRLERERSELKRRQEAVRKKLAAAKRLLAQMSPDERAEHSRASRSSRGGERSAGAGGASRGFGATGAGASSGRAAAAVAAAKSAVGRPYAWGASGPGSFDCSGLMQWAYGRAGTALPRTSQAQRSAGRQVPLGQARPGDLVVYKDDASHVGMYVGHGRVVHAPHPGAAVRYDPVGMMPISSVTRP